MNKSVNEDDAIGNVHRNIFIDTITTTPNMSLNLNLSTFANKNLDNDINKRVPRDIALETGVIIGQLCSIGLYELPKVMNGCYDMTVIPTRTSTLLTFMLRKLFELMMELCRAYDLNLITCIQEKISLNSKKYPTNLCKGKVNKYTEYSNETGITKTNQIMTHTRTSATSAKEDLESSRADDCNHEASTKDIAVAMLTGICIDRCSLCWWDAFPNLTRELNAFAMERDWMQHYTPRNLIFALVSEFGELTELMQWEGDTDDNENDCESNNFFFNDDVNKEITMKKPKQQQQHQQQQTKFLLKMSHEIADVTIYALRLATACHILDDIVHEKKTMSKQNNDDNKNKTNKQNRNSQL